MLMQHLDHSRSLIAVPRLQTPRTGPAANLNDEESRTLERLKECRPDLVGPFLDHLRPGRRGILLRFFQAAVREQICGRSQSSTWLNGGRTLQVRLPGGGELRVKVARRMALGRFDVEGIIVVRRHGRSMTIEHPGELLDVLDENGLGGRGDAEARKRLARFRKELENSATNLALALAGASQRREVLAEEADRRGATTSLEYVKAMESVDPMFSPLAFYEQWVVEGHPLHPGARMKMGMEVNDVIGNAPEWGARPGVALVAVARSACRVVTRGKEGAVDLLTREYPAIRPGVSAALARLGKSAEDYELIPVHPWQLAHTLPKLHAGPIERGEVIPIPGCILPAFALISVRSFAPVQRRGERKHHLKTAINVHMTSAVRTVSPNAAENGPVLSAVLAEISRREDKFGGQFAAVAEDVGIYYQPTDSGLDPDTAALQCKHLAAMLRENPENFVRDGEIAMPAAALTALSPLGSGPIIAELIDAYAAQRGLIDRRQAAVGFIRRYAQVSVPALLTLMTRYGIALEAHMQNSVCVFRDGELTRMLVRDLGAVRVLPERLQRQNLTLTLMPGSAILADDLEDLRNKVYYSFFQNHLAELIVAIVRHLGVDEQALWKEVSLAARAAFDVLKIVDGLKDLAAGDAEALFRPRLALKALATMRLKDDVTDYTFAEVPNPLAECTPNEARSCA
jgi:siderophore synthetase component